MHKINHPIFIFSLNSIIKCWFDYCFLKNYTFHKSTSESSGGEFWSSNPNNHVCHFATSNQCNRPNLLENTMVKLRSVYGQWLVDFDPQPLSVSLWKCGLSILAVILIKGNEKCNRKHYEKFRASDISRKRKHNFAGFSRANSRKNLPILRDFHGKKVKIRWKIGQFHRIFTGESQNSLKNRPISRDFSGKKSNLTTDFQWQILRKIGPFHAKFRRETSPRNNQ